MGKLFILGFIFFISASLAALPFSAADSVVSYSYDNAGRLIEADYGEKTITYTYDPAGNLLERTIVAHTSGGETTEGDDSSGGDDPADDGTTEGGDPTEGDASTGGDGGTACFVGAISNW